MDEYMPVQGPISPAEIESMADYLYQCGATEERLTRERAEHLGCYERVVIHALARELSVYAGHPWGSVLEYVQAARDEALVLVEEQAAMEAYCDAVRKDRQDSLRF